MKTNRLEAFSDGVIAIIITIMVLEMKVPHGNALHDLYSLLPVFLSYVLSFIYVGIYWNNHHHLLHMVKKVTAPILWANLHLLFWLSLFPFATGWMGENHFTSIPTMLYGVVMMMASLASWLLVAAISASEGDNSSFKTIVGKNAKGKASVFLYLFAAILAIWVPSVALAIYVIVALFWFVPDKKVERELHVKVK
ncbi:TMEM175 family protein [Labilibaculum sp. K2S]|uniref:TMEM175 family protein n=1 Tax=Labilibaculum sp. K2S TaxID=3056386 RepID=UPI0025A4A237|nr:TMEM175 family protein [Labilibaculum sp. K2S]MDM8161827.1 TMEM175 family protein [Labilibaculum sp. K2S]